MSAVDIYAVGVISMSLCAAADLSAELIEEHANREHPTGIRSRWELSTDTHFASGQPNPCPCEQSPARLHYLLHC